jgi:hypothetical protein
MPTQEEVKRWGKNELFDFIKGRPQLLEDDDDLENFKAAKISGMLFLRKAGDTQFFENKCHLPVGPSEELAYLASEIKGEVKEDPAPKRKQDTLAEHGNKRVRGKELSFLQIRPYGPIRPRDPVLQIPPLNRNGFSSILETAETTQMPTIFHGPYQSGKTSLLYSMSDDLSSRGYHVFFVDLDDAIQLENFTVEGFYQELSVQVLRIEKVNSGRTLKTHMHPRRPQSSSWTKCNVLFKAAMWSGLSGDSAGSLTRMASPGLVLELPS